jgi:hypothetical protein
MYSSRARAPAQSGASIFYGCEFACLNGRPAFRRFECTREAAVNGKCGSASASPATAHIILAQAFFGLGHQTRTSISFQQMLK